MGAAAGVLTALGLAESVDPLMGLKTREEKLEKVFSHMDKNEDGHLDMGELACISEKLDKAGVEEVRREFIRLDQDEDGIVTQAEFVDYYLDQLEGYEDREFNFWCMAYIRIFFLHVLYKPFLFFFAIIYKSLNYFATFFTHPQHNAFIFITKRLHAIFNLLLAAFH